MRYCSKAQRGMSLLESLVALVLLTILGLGSTYVAVKTMGIQRDTNLNSLVVSKGRSQIQEGSCITQLNITADTKLDQAVTCNHNEVNTTVTAKDASGSLLYEEMVLVVMPSLATSNKPINIGYDK